MQISTVTSKGQVTIPAEARRKWELEAGEKVVFVEKDDSLEVRPAVNFFKLRGSVRSRKKYSDKAADKAVGKHIAAQYGQKKSKNAGR